MFEKHVTCLHSDNLDTKAILANREAFHKLDQTGKRQLGVNLLREAINPETRKFTFTVPIVRGGGVVGFCRVCWLWYVWSLVLACSHPLALPLWYAERWRWWHPGAPCGVPQDVGVLDGRQQHLHGQLPKGHPERLVCRPQQQAGIDVRVLHCLMHRTLSVLEPGKH